MEEQKFLFVGGSREGVQVGAFHKKSVTFVDGILAIPGVDIHWPINATWETYEMEHIERGDAPPVPAYVLEGFGPREIEERLKYLLAKFTPEGNRIGEH